MLLCCKFLCPEGLTPYSNSSHRAYWHAPPLPPMPCLPVWWLHNALQTALSTTRHPSHAHPSPSWPSTQSCSWPAMLSHTPALAKSKSKKILFTVWLLVSGVVVSPVSAAGGWALSPDEGNSGYPSVAVMVGGATCSGWCCTWSSGGGGGGGGGGGKTPGGRPREGAGSRHWSVSQRGRSLVGAAHLCWQVILRVFHTFRRNVCHTSGNKGTRDYLSPELVTPFPRTIHKRLK